MTRNIYQLFTYIIAMCVVITLHSCADDDIPAPATTDSEDYGDYFFIVKNGSSESMGSRVEYDKSDYHHSVFENGDLVGVYVLDESGNPMNGQPGNVPYGVYNVTSMTEDGHTFQTLIPSGSQKVVQGNYTYFFYYPYNPDITSFNELKNLTFSIQTDQSTAKGIDRSDLLWDLASSSDQGKHVSVLMEHVMASIIINVDEKSFDIKKGVNLLGIKTTASGINLPGSPELTDMAYTVESDPTADIATWNGMLSTTGLQIFRCVIPACQTIAANTRLISAWNVEDGKQKAFRIKKELTLKPGHVYVFTLSKKSTILPDIGAEGSWVLDVLDPETGEQVGLLCREYVHYQPQLSNDMKFKDDQITYPGHQGVPPAKTDGGMTAITSSPTINSQAWVFYNLCDASEVGDRKIPDLRKGTIMRIVYDFRMTLTSGGVTVIQAMEEWPYPHNKGTGGRTAQTMGIYPALHGHDWIFDGTYGRSTREGETYSDNQRYYEFYKDATMHGYDIYWDGNENIIRDIEKNPKIYTAPDTYISNSTAYNLGHIAIPDNEDELPYVSYDEIRSDGRDIKNNKVGVIFSHWIVDTRKNTEGRTESQRYPIVKIGFNQFWMSQSLRARTLLDGTPLKCFTNNDELGTYNGDRWADWPPMPLQPAGYMYPSGEIEYDDNGTTKKFQYNPLRIHGEEECDRLGIPLLYNYRVIKQDPILPNSPEGAINTYHNIELSAITRIANYIGAAWLGKMMSDKVRFKGDKVRYDIMADCDSMKYVKDENNVVYPGNVSGFNLKATGYKSQWNAISSKEYLPLGVSGSLLVKPRNDNEMLILFSTMVKSFNAGVNGDLNENLYVQEGYGQVNGSQYKDGIFSTTFGQIRFYYDYNIPSSHYNGISRIARFSKATHGKNVQSNVEYIEIE